MTENTVIELPTIPSKWDIIPIHNSDRATFKFCRRQWSWSSPSRANLIRKASVHGIYEPFWFGEGIHYALQRYYDPLLKEDPATTWLTWFDLQWHGGLVTASEVHKFADREPQDVSYPKGGLPHGEHPHDYGYEGEIYKVAGLKEILPFGDDPEIEDKFMNYRDLGEGMMKFYKSWAEVNDNFTVIAVEHEFSVPILDPQGKPLYMVDRREMPEGWEPDFEEENVYGPLTKMSAEWDESYVKQVPNPNALVVKQVHARGRMDMILQEHEHGRYGIQDYKTASSVDEDYFRHLELDEQCTSYLWAGEIEANLHDLPYKKLEFINYIALFKGYPRPPTITSRGYPSLDRAKESTTVRLFEQAIEAMSEVDPTIKPWFQYDQKAQSYYQWLMEIGDKRFIWPEEVWRNSIQRTNAGIRIYYEALDMLNPEMKTYPNPTKNYSCLNCIFRAPCIAAETGADYKSILEEGYMPNWDR